MRVVLAALSAIAFSCAPSSHWENKNNPNANWDKDWYECDVEVKSRRHPAATGGIAGAIGVASQMINEQQSCIAARGWKQVANTPAVIPAAVAPSAPTLSAVPVDIVSDPPDAEVYVDGRFVGTAPILQFKLLPGKHSIEVRKLGFMSWLRELSVQQGTPSQVRAELRRE